jgi:hypothetical protein
MWGHWDCMHDACGGIDTACKMKFSNNFENYKSYANGFTMQKNEKCMQCQWHCRRNACSVIDNGCSMHTVSLTPYAGGNGAIDTACPPSACGVNDTARAIDERFAWHGSLEREYLSTTYMFANFPTPPLQKYINLKGSPNKSFFCIRKSIISRRIRSRIPKVFSLWIRVTGGILFDEKKPKVQNLVALSL